MAWHGMAAIEQNNKIKQQNKTKHSNILNRRLYIISSQDGNTTLASDPQRPEQSKTRFLGLEESML